MARLFIALLIAALALPACTHEQARTQGGASTGQSAPPAGGTDLGAEAEKEEAKMRKPLDSGRADSPGT